MYPNFKPITPHSLTQSISYKRDNKEWVYCENERSAMPGKQAEGAAHLFNLLINDGVALLADEVGMGKTMQALAVLASLWQQKPNAKVLVLAPRDEIARNWINEYETFINIHYKLNDDKVKTRYSNRSVHPAHLCTNLYNLVKQYLEVGKHFFVGKISSFSSMFSADAKKILTELGVNTEKFENIDLDNSSIEGARLIGKLLNELMTEKNGGEPPFDLVIVDEAHYFRNTEGGSLKVNAAKGFFGAEKQELSKCYLLLTATPNHNSGRNIQSIFSYFKEGTENEDPQILLKKYAVRRFRRLSTEGYMKYNYRHEKPLIASFADDPMSEIFFGLYQKKLAMDYLKETDKQKKNRMLNFLEGTEFIPKQQPLNTNDDEEENDEKQSNSSDYTKGFDGEMLSKLASDFKAQFDAYPKHPKYDVLINALTNQLNVNGGFNEKNLVFVRRIPSVKEIAGRVNLSYDQMLWAKLTNIFAKHNKSFTALNDLTRSSFESLMKKTLEIANEDEDANQTKEDIPDDGTDDNVSIVEGFWGSKVLDLFKVLRKDDTDNNIPRTHASNFRLRFLKSKPGIFPMFFSPASDYKESGYINMPIIDQKYSEKKTDSNFYLSALSHRLNQLNDTNKHKVNVLLGLNDDSRNIENSDKSAEGCLDTLLTIFWHHLANNNEHLENYEKCKNIYNSFSNCEKEAFSNFLEKGIIYASSAIVDLYCNFIDVQLSTPTKDRIGFYKAYTETIKQKFGETILPQLIISSLDSFKLICEKVFNLQNDEDLLKCEWKVFLDQVPAYPYWGATKNQKVISAFNTPFFPDVLIATSVLQEGVNLQYYCKNIIHYGIAWTPGDNEQRVGRVDRMFGKIEQELDKNKGGEKANLNILYPYLQHTIDQDHVANFIYKKHSEENRIDRCFNVDSDKKLNYEDFSIENWETYFRQPVDSKDFSDPYGVDINGFKNIVANIEKTPNHYLIKEKIIKTLSELEECLVFSNHSTDYQSSDICVVLGEISTEKKKKREQPIFLELEYCPISSDLMGESIYVLVLKTPLGNKEDRNAYRKEYDSFQNQYVNEYITAKICIDEKQPPKSHFYVYMKTEIPLFPESDFNELSKDEIKNNVKNLITWSDNIERMVLGDKKDLKLNSIDKSYQESKEIPHVGGMRDINNPIELHGQWEKVSEFRRILNATCTNNNIDHHETWIKNHAMVFVKNYLHNGALNMSIAYLDNDVQSKEIQLLEKTLKHWQNAP